ncbi:hypothetical protein [Paenibacillus donghaensis]|uniref:Uncharacterized protein n=1 Tax=Paenibacillus donghaensis TaxID=414771 RepID=A0A2Z2K451_9BACL|nr:hypothetical protein [Paenibacillus donghaensis]ASA20446.1 hypothetical protein B9T62_06285 [Paenibacillus donghaensis]
MYSYQGYPYYTQGRIPPILLHINDLKPFIGKWGIFTIGNEKVVAYVDSVDTAANSAKVYYPDNSTGVIDIAMISMAAGPYVTMPTGTGPTPSPTPIPTPAPTPLPTNCQWVYLPAIGWKYLCL